MPSNELFPLLRRRVRPVRGGRQHNLKNVDVDIPRNVAEIIARDVARPQSWVVASAGAIAGVARVDVRLCKRPWPGSGGGADFGVTVDAREFLITIESI
jgi:hypothetical protein